MGRKRKPPIDGEAEVISFEEAKQQLKEQIEATSQEIDTSLFSDDAALQRMNDKHAFVKSYGGKPCVTNLIFNEVVNKEVLEFMSPDSIQIIYSNQTVMVNKNAKPLGSWWIQHADRKTFNTVIFDPAKPREYNNCLNLWEGFSTEPREGAWKRTLKHIYKILCNGEADKFKYFIRWLAWAVQNPATQAEVCVIFKGKEGAGKGFIFTQLVELFGIHGFTLANRELLTGKHNGHLQRIVFLFADEAYYPGDKEAEGVLKQLITQPVISYRAMYREAVLGANRLHIGMSTNNDWVIPAGTDARRYFINEVDNSYAKGECTDQERNVYFSRLWGEMLNGGRAAMLFDLLKMDLKDFHPRISIPHTDEMDNQRLLNLNALESAVHSILDNGIFQGEYKNIAYTISSKSYTDWVISLEPKAARFSAVKTTELIKTLGARKIRKTEGIWWEFPELQEMRRTWERLYGKQKWDISEKWIVRRQEY